MALSGFPKVVYRTFVTLAFRIFRTVFLGLQSLYWELNGTARQIREGGDPINYDRSAHVVDPFMFHTFCELQSTTIDDFVYVHNRFESPRYVIDNDHVTLMAVDERNAYFIEAKDKGTSSDIITASCSFICILLDQMNGGHKIADYEVINT